MHMCERLPSNPFLSLINGSDLINIGPVGSSMCTCVFRRGGRELREAKERGGVLVIGSAALVVVVICKLWLVQYDY